MLTAMMDDWRCDAMLKICRLEENHKKRMARRRSLATNKNVVTGLTSGIQDIKMHTSVPILRTLRPSMGNKVSTTTGIMAVNSGTIIWKQFAGNTELTNQGTTNMLTCLFDGTLYTGLFCEQNKNWWFELSVPELSKTQYNKWTYSIINAVRPALELSTVFLFK